MPSLAVIDPNLYGLVLSYRAILQSGTTIDPAWGPISEDDADTYGRKLAGHLKCPSTKTTLECFQDKDVSEFPNAIWFMSGSLWMPSYSSNSDNFLTGKPIKPKDILESPDFNKDGSITDVIIGTTKDEGLLYFYNDFEDSSNWWYDLSDSYPSTAARYLFNLPFTSEVQEKHQDAADKVIKKYIEGIENYNPGNLQKNVDMFTDAAELFGSFKTAQKLTARGINVYQYILSYEGKNSWSELYYGQEPRGVCHGDDLFYLFTMPYFNKVKLDDKDIEIKNVMVDAWTNFANSGNPNDVSIPKKKQWKKTTVGANPGNIMRFWDISGETQAMKNDKNLNKRMKFWDNIMEGLEA